MTARHSPPRIPTPAMRIEDYPPDPYPGARPPGSWRLTGDGRLHALRSTGGSQWEDAATGEPVSLDGRELVLGYGSNANPYKLQQWLSGDVLALAVTVEGWAAVWCSARRGSGDVVCTLAPVPATRERHVVLAVTTAQRQLMDRWEGHPGWYARQPFTGRLTYDDGTPPATAVAVYLGTPTRRPVLRVAGAPLRCADVPYDVVDRLVGWSW